VVNDSLGHEVGDLMLIQVAQRLGAVLRNCDTVTPPAAAAGATAERDSTTAGRLGGDEFIVILDYLREFHDAARVTERILKALAAPYQIKGHVVYSTVSVGITTRHAAE